PLVPSGCGRLEDLEGLPGGEGVGEVPPVDERDEIGRVEVGEDLPYGSAERSGVQIPEGVDERGRGHVDHALLGAEPAQLRIAGEGAGEWAEPFGQVVDVDADDVVGQGVDRGDADLVAPTDREREAVALEVTVGLENDVGGGVVRIGV